MLKRDVKRQQCKKKNYNYIQKFHHGKPSWNFTTVWTNRAQVSIPGERVENNHVNELKMTDYAPGFKIEQEYIDWIGELQKSN